MAGRRISEMFLALGMVAVDLSYVNYNEKIPANFRAISPPFERANWRGRRTYLEYDAETASFFHLLCHYNQVVVIGRNDDGKR